jgi:hypothetical protein
LIGDRRPVGFPINHQLETINQPNFSVKEKDEASLSNCFRQDSLDAFILRFAELKAFLFVSSSSSSS